MSQFISPVATNNTSNNSPNLRDESFLEMKNFLYSLEKNLRDKELTITNLKNEISFSLENLKNQVNQYQNRINELEVENRQLNYSNIVSTYESISPNGTTYVVDIDGNTYEIK